jgi:hypothetical protein
MVATAIGVLTLSIGMVPAHADPGDEGRLLSLTNQVRSSRGLPPLTIDAQLTAVAQKWASTLAGRGVISHNASLPSQVTGWTDLGENVGLGGTVDAIHDGFLASPTHLQNLVDPTYTRVGFGIVRPDARLFVVEVFMLPASGASTAPAPAPSASTAPAASTSVAPPAPAKAAIPVTPSPAAPAVSQLSPWMVLSLEGLRSMEPRATA